MTQGTRLGMFLFLVLINFAGFRQNTNDNNIGNEITKLRNARKSMSKTHMKYIDDLSLEILSHNNGMVINQEKKVMLFNPRKEYYFQPLINTCDGNVLEVVEEAQVLGIVVQSDMSWKSNSNLLCRRGFSRLWLLRNLARLGTR